MSSSISESTRTNLFRSIAAVEAAAPAIIDGLAASLARAEGEAAPFTRARAIAGLLVQMLLEQAAPMIERRELSGVGEIGAAHAAQGIDGRHYSGFGDALVPVLKDALGPRLPGAVASAWCDAFWLVIRLVLQEGHRQPAQGSGLDGREGGSLEIVGAHP
jgi:hemoglobin-like flavoprotein